MPVVARSALVPCRFNSFTEWIMTSTDLTFQEWLDETVVVDSRMPFLLRPASGTPEAPDGDT